MTDNSLSKQQNRLEQRVTLVKSYNHDDKDDHRYYIYSKLRNKSIVLNS